MVKGALEKDFENILKKYSTLNLTLQKQKKTITSLETSLKYEKFKNSLYVEIIKKFTPIDISAVLKEENNELHIHDSEPVNISVFLHEINGTTEKIKFVKREITGKETEESPDVQEQKIKLVEDKKQEVLKENFDIPYNSTIQEIEQNFEEMKGSRIMGKNLAKIVKLRSKLLGKISVEQYIEMIKENLEKIKGIIGKKYTEKKVAEVLDSSFTSLEQRLISLPGYYKKHLDVDEQNKFILALEVNMNHPSRYIPFSLSDFFSKLFNYSIVILPLKENLSRILVNPYNFNTIVYVDDGKETEDPFRFYVLEKIADDTKRHWRLDCRLDDFCRKTNIKLLEYCRELFRKMYFDIFSDNDYREEYKSSPLASEDMQQLLINYVELSNYKSYCEMVQGLIIEKCTYKPTKLDKLNIKSDDSISRKNFSLLNDSPDLVTENVMQLFDTITDEEAGSLISVQ